MSSATTAWAWDQRVKQNAKLLLLFLGEACDRWGSGHNLDDVLSHAVVVCGFDSQTARTHMTELQELGLVIVGEDGRYRLNSPAPALATFRL